MASNEWYCRQAGNKKKHFIVIKVCIVRELLQSLERVESVVIWDFSIHLPLSVSYYSSKILQFFTSFFHLSFGFQHCFHYPVFGRHVIQLLPLSAAAQIVSKRRRRNAPAALLHMHIRREVLN